MKSKILKYSGIIILILVISTLLIYHLCLDEFIRNQLKVEGTQLLRANVEIQSVDVSLPKTQLILKKFRVRNSLDSDSDVRHSFESITLKIDPLNSSKNKLQFSKLIIDELFLNVQLNSQEFEATLFGDGAQEIDSESGYSPQFFFESIEVNNLILEVTAPNFSKQVKVPNFQIKDLKVADDLLPPMVYLIRSLVKEVLRESRKHIKGEVMDQLRGKIRNKAIKLIGDRLSDNLQSIGVNSSKLGEVGRRIEKDLKKKLRRLF